MANEQLQVEIIARNKVNKYIQDYAPALFANAQQLIGRKVTKKDGNLTVMAHDILDIPKINTTECMIFATSVTHSIAITFKAHAWLPNAQEHASDHSAYAEDTVYIADVDSYGVATEINNFDTNDYPIGRTITEILAAREEFRRIEKLYDEAKAACDPFGVR